MLRTKVDKLAELIKKPTSFSEAANNLKIPSDLVEFIARTLEKAGFCAISYPPVGSPVMKLLKDIHVEKEKVPKDVDDSYGFDMEGVPVEILIYRDIDRRPFYHTIIPKPGPATMAFLTIIRPEIAKGIPFETSYFLTPEKMQEHLPIIREKIKEKIARYFEDEGKNWNILTGLLFTSMYGLGEIEVFMHDDGLEEVAVNTSTIPVAVYHQKYGWMKTNVTMPDEETIANMATQIARRVGSQINISSPILDAFLTTGDRAAATLYPASTKGNTITIRKFARDPWTVVKFIENHTLSLDMAALLWQAVHYELNIVTTGGTASGKTSLLNTLTQLIPSYQRVVTIEETRELTLPDHVWNWIPLLTRVGGQDERGKLTMAKLLTTSLRLRPDRVILGEIRTPSEAVVLFDAMHTGHSVSTTFHADTATQLLRRMLEAPFNIHAAEAEAIHLIVVQHRDRRRNIRRTLEISEVIPAAEGKLSTNRLFIWRPRTDTFEAVNRPRRFVEEINLYTGMTNREINDDLNERKRILSWMREKNYSALDKVGEVMKAYYNVPDILMEAVNKNKEL